MTAAAPRRSTGKGQWALGHTEPLNPNERIKKDDDGLNVRDRIINVYAHTGFTGIDPADLRGRFRWWGLYTQRKPGIPGGRTGSLEPEELDDEYFMLRVRIDGGQLTSEQLGVIAEIAREFGRDVADVTDRQNIQLHWIRVEDVPEIWRRLEAVGLSTTEACGDTPRVILSCPLAGVSEDELIDPSETVREVVDRFIGDPGLSNLPRKFKSSISGCTHQCTHHEIHDVAFVAVRAGQGDRSAGEPSVGSDAGSPVGYQLFVGGGLSTNPKLAKSLGVLVAPEQVAEVWAGVAALFRDYGYRRSRTQARIKFLMADWGPEKFRDVLQREYLGYELPDGPEPPPPITDQRDHIGLTRQRDGRYTVGGAPRAGRTSGTALAEVAKITERYGSGRIRATAQQKLLVLDVAEDDTAAVAAELASLELEVHPSTFRRSTMACTGLEFCKLAIVETKARATWLTDELEQRLPDFTEPISIHVNGCPNACARFQTADIGFKGSIVRDDAGNQVEGFQVHLGGHLGVDASFGRKFRGLKVTADGAADYVERVLREFSKRRRDGESFAAYVARADEDWLR